jgi:hypothetical protein
MDAYDVLLFVHDLFWDNLTDEERRRRICRAAAEITGLTPGIVGYVELTMKNAGWPKDGAARTYLRRFAELAEEQT